MWPAGAAVESVVSVLGLLDSFRKAKSMQMCWVVLSLVVWVCV